MAIIKYDRLKDAPYRDKNNRCLPVEFGKNYDNSHIVVQNLYFVKCEF